MADDVGVEVVTDDVHWGLRMVPAVLEDERLPCGRRVETRIATKLETLLQVASQQVRPYVIRPTTGVQTGHQAREAAHVELVAQNLQQHVANWSVEQLALDPRREPQPSKRQKQIAEPTVALVERGVEPVSRTAITMTERWLASSCRCRPS